MLFKADLRQVVRQCILDTSAALVQNSTSLHGVSGTGVLATYASTTCIAFGNTWTKTVTHHPGA